MGVMGKNLLVLLLMFLLLFGGVSSAPSTTSPASECFYLSLEAACFFCLICFLFFLSLWLAWLQQISFFSLAEIVSGLFSNVASAFMKWLWSLKATTKTGLDL